MTGQAVRPIHPLLADLTDLAGASKQKQFAAAATLPLKAAGFLARRPRLWGWVVLPALISLTFFMLSLIVLATNVPRLLNWAWARPEFLVWWDALFIALWYVAFALLFATSVVVSYFLVLLVSGIVASPINEVLSQRTEQELTGTVADARSGESKFSGTLRSIVTSLCTLALYLLCIVPLLSLHLLPGVGSLVYSVLVGCLSAVFLAIEYTDAPLDRRGLSFREKLATLKQNRASAAGFGAGTTLMMLIPLANLLVLPLAVVGGTILGVALHDKSPHAGASPPQHPDPDQS